RIIQGIWVRRRRGVMPSVINRKVSVHLPVVRVMTSMGLAPNRSWKPFHVRTATGPRHSTNTMTLSTRTKFSLGEGIRSFYAGPFLNKGLPLDRRIHSTLRFRV